MAHKPGKKEESRVRLLRSAGRGFRAQGFGGLGVDAIAGAAGVTSGAFYAHFPSKAAVFREVVAAGMAELANGISAFKEKGGTWRSAFVDFYLGECRTCDIGESCALQALTGEVARADIATRKDYQSQLCEIVDLMAGDAKGRDLSKRRADSIALLALLSGGVSMARAVADPGLGAEIADAVRKAADRLGSAERGK